MVCIPDSRFAICFWSCSSSVTILSSWNPMRCAGTLPFIKNVRGRSPRPICVMTCSSCDHGAIHLRQTMKAMQPNATQIRTMTSQVTAFLFFRYFSQQTGCKDVSQSQTTSCKFSLGTIPFLRQVWSARPPHTAFAPKLLLFAEPIAETAHGFNRRASFAELFAQATHVRVDRARVDNAFITPDVV